MKNEKVVLENLRFGLDELLDFLASQGMSLNNDILESLRGTGAEVTIGEVVVSESYEV